VTGWYAYRHTTGTERRYARDDLPHALVDVSFSVC
jgi:hypothetical protein